MLLLDASFEFISVIRRSNRHSSSTLYENLECWL